jgi:hypothetical protein
MNRFEEAYNMLTKIARVNRIQNFNEKYDRITFIRMMKTYKREKYLREMYSESYHMLRRNVDEKKNNEENYELDYTEDQLADESPIERAVGSKKSAFKKIYYPFYNFFKLIALIFVWNSITLNYIGITIGITTVLHVNPYAIYLLSCLFEFFGTLMCHMNDRLGRKRALFIYLVSVSVSFMFVSVLPDESTNAHAKWLMIAKASFALLGKSFISAAYNTNFVYSTELYETEIRTTAVLVISCFGYIGSFFAPQINHLVKPLPYIVFCATTFICCIIIHFLPETFHSHANNNT